MLRRSYFEVNTDLILLGTCKIYAYQKRLCSNFMAIKDFSKSSIRYASLRKNVQNWYIHLTEQPANMDIEKNTR